MKLNNLLKSSLFAIAGGLLIAVPGRAEDEVYNVQTSRGEVEVRFASGGVESAILRKDKKNGMGYSYWKEPKDEKAVATILNGNGRVYYAWFPPVDLRASVKSPDKFVKIFDQFDKDYADDQKQVVEAHKQIKEARKRAESAVKKLNGVTLSGGLVPSGEVKTVTVSGGMNYNWDNAKIVELDEMSAGGVGLYTSLYDSVMKEMAFAHFRGVGKNNYVVGIRDKRGRNIGSCIINYTRRPNAAEMFVAPVGEVVEIRLFNPESGKEEKAEINAENIQLFFPSYKPSIWRKLFKK